LRTCSRFLLATLALSGAAAAAPTTPMPLETYMDKARGGWAGQMIGVSYGSVYEFNAQGQTYEGPIRTWEPQFVDNSLGQDDLYVDMTFLQALEDYGLGVTFAQAGKAFADSKYGLAHANYYGRENVRNGLVPPLSGDPAHNAHFDDIDYQIEADFGGLVAPGMPQAANRIAEVFGHVMNWGDGVYGGMWVGAMYSMAFFEDDVERLVTESLHAIPAESTYAELIRDVIAAHEADPSDWRAAWRKLEDRWGAVDVCPDGRNAPFNIDAKLNGGYIAIALLYGDGDFGKTMEIALRCGQDNDCNPASAAGILGTVLGFRGIPERYTAGIPAIADREFAFTTYSFNTVAEASARIARQVVKAEGGRISPRDSSEVWHIARRPATPPKQLEQFVDVALAAQLTAAPFEGGIRLEWQPVRSARRYAVLRRPTGTGVWQALATVPASARSFVDHTVRQGQAFDYTLRPELGFRGTEYAGIVHGYLISPVAENLPSAENLALAADAWVDAQILNPTGGGLKDISVIRNGIRDENYDSFDGANPLDQDWYAIRWPRAVHANRVVYVEGKSFDNGGWWLSLRLQVLDPVSKQWRDVPASVSPAYDHSDHQAGRQPYTAFTFEFPTLTCAGLRVVGEPGGTAAFTSIGELEVYYAPHRGS